MKRRTLTSNILSLIKRNIPSICTVLILSSPEPRKRGGSTVIYAHGPALLIGLLGWSLWDRCFSGLRSRARVFRGGGGGRAAAGSLGEARGAHSRPLLCLW